MSFLRVLAPSATLFLMAACQMTGNPRPALIGDWHLVGASSGLASTSDGGDFGDTDTIAGNLQAGQMVTERVLAEGVVALSYTSSEIGGADVDTTLFDVGAGARYYFDHQGNRRPYVAGLVGLRYMDVDDSGGVDDSDVSPLLQVRAGMETFMTDSVALDFGVSLQHVFDAELGGTEDDVTTLGAFIGISIWL